MHHLVIWRTLSPKYSKVLINETEFYVLCWAINTHLGILLHWFFSNTWAGRTLEYYHLNESLKHTLEILFWLFPDNTYHLKNRLAGYFTVERFSDRQLLMCIKHNILWKYIYLKERMLETFLPPLPLETQTAWQHSWPRNRTTPA